MILYSGDGQQIATTVTDNSGHYSFPNLQPGNYIIEFVTPTGYTPSPSGTDPANNTDSNADPATGRTPIIELLPGEQDPNWDAGFHRTPTNIGDGNEPVPSPRVYLPLVSRLRFKLQQQGNEPVQLPQCSDNVCLSR